MRQQSLLAGSTESCILQPRMWYVYVLESQHDKRLYTGVTNDLNRRLQEHQNGHTQTTSRMQKIEIVYYEACINKLDAAAREKQLKTGFGRGYIKRRLENYLMGR